MITQRMSSPMEDMVLYREEVKMRDKYPYTLEGSAEGDEFLCRAVRGVLTKVLDVVPGELIDSVEEILLELMEMTGNESRVNNLDKLSHCLQEISAAAAGVSLQGPVDTSRRLEPQGVTIGDLCKLLAGVQFGERAQQMQILRATLASRMQDEDVQAYCDKLAKKAMEAEIASMNVESDGESRGAAKRKARKAGAVHRASRRR